MQYLFGYGSLINKESRKKSIKTSTHIPVRIKGLQRSWGYPCPKNHYTAVQVSKNENASTNGVLIPLQDPIQDLLILDERELNYNRTRIDIKNIYHYFNNEILHLPQDSIVWVYESKNLKNSLQLPIPQSYIDCCLTGCLSISIEFAKEFITNTSGWSLFPLIFDRFTENKKIKQKVVELHLFVIVDQLLIEHLVI
ncbi:hypothetical protein HDV06_001920 [Boothiomyces sp. JEL0866]|nr:hypothetical protein HDV06_001920 [Boothiomyces sp. JEL0866]